MSAAVEPRPLTDLMTDGRPDWGQNVWGASDGMKAGGEELDSVDGGKVWL